MIELREPSILMTVPFSTFFGKAKAGVLLSDSARTGREIKRFAPTGLVVIAINKANLIITRSFFCCCHIYP